MNLTPHFTLEELTRSQEALRLGVKNTPNITQLEELRLLCEVILEPLRDLIKSANPTDFVIINSGFRSKPVNDGVGSNDTSQHLKGQAADIIFVKTDLKTAFKLIAKSSIPYDQLIYEFGGWIHVSRSDKPRRQLLHAYKDKQKKTIYKPLTLKDLDTYEF